MIQTIQISTFCLQESLKSIHNIKNVHIYNESDASNWLNFIIKLTNLDKIIEINKVEKHYTASSDNDRKVYKVSLKNLKEDVLLFSHTLEKFTQHLNIENPILNSEINAIYASNIIQSFFSICTFDHLIKYRYGKYIGVSDLDINEIKIKYNNPKLFTFLNNIGVKDSLLAIEILKNKNYHVLTDEKLGSNLFAFESD